MSPADVDAPSARSPGRPRDSVANDAIIDAALSLLDEGCYSDITIEKIAQRAGVGKPTIYRRWKTKADVVLVAYATRVAQRGSPIVPSDDAFADLQTFLDRLFTVTNHPTNNRALRCFIAESQYDDEFRAKLNDVFLSKRRAAVIAILQHGQKLGQFRADIDLEIVADIVYGGFAARLLKGQLSLDSAFAAAIVDMLRHGIGANRR